MFESKKKESSACKDRRYRVDVYFTISTSAKMFTAPPIMYVDAGSPEDK